VGDVDEGDAEIALEPRQHALHAHHQIGVERRERLVEEQNLGLEDEGVAVDACWADDACIDERAGTQAEAGEIARIRGQCGWRGLSFGGAATTGDDRGDRWYLRMMAPNIRGEKFAWLDPSAMYVNGRAFHALIDDLAAPFQADGIDVVAAMDAAGFVLGAALATRLGKGLLTIRKAGKLPVDTDSVEFVNYTGRTQELEIRTPAIRPGARVLIVDQWIETGGTMDGAIRLVEGQGGTVAGIACVCIEETPAGVEIRRKYKCATAVMPGTDYQAQCNAKYLDFFAGFDWRSFLPDSPEGTSA
jgi:adenine phosphoribosyltransferase